MNVVERQSQVTRELYEINVDTMKQLVGLSGEGVKRYLNLNAEYLHEIVERPGPTRFLELQRRYGESLLAGLRDDAQAGGRILSQALERTSSTLLGAWSSAGNEPESLERVAEPLRASQLPRRPVEVLEAGAAPEDASADAEDVATSAAAPGPDHDDQPVSERLERVTGIGRAMASQLRDAGVATLTQLAALDVEALADADHPLHNLRPRIEAEHWVGQARELLDAPPH